MKISDRAISLLISENFNKDDIVYISTENWNIMFDGNRGLKRFPSDDYMKKLKTFYINKILGKVVDVYSNGTIDVKFNELTFGLKNEFVTKLAKGQKVPSPEKVVEENIDDFKVGDRVIGINDITKYYNKKGIVHRINEYVYVIFEDFNNGRPWGANPDNIKKIDYTTSKYVRQLKFESLNENKEFKVGDKVIVNKDIMSYGGMKGKVVHIYSDSVIGVDFGKEILGGHSCHGRCKDKQGRYFEKFTLIKISNSKYVKQLNFESYEPGQEIDINMHVVYKELKELFGNDFDYNEFEYRWKEDDKDERVIISFISNREYKKWRNIIIKFAKENHLNVFVNYNDGVKTYFVVITKQEEFPYLTDSTLITESLDKLSDQVNKIIKKMQSEGKVKPEEIANRVQKALKLELTRDEIIKRYIRNVGGQFDSQF